MNLTQLDATTFQLTGPGFAGTLAVNAGPTFRALTLGGVALPDWKSSDHWQFPVCDGESVNGFREARLVERSDAIAMQAEYASADGQLRAILHWEADRQHDALECFWEIRNDRPRAVEVDHLWPFQFHTYVPEHSPIATYLTGTGELFATARRLWASEYTPRTVSIAPGVCLRLQETWGSSSETQHPWLFLTWPEDAFTMTVASAWSGNWLIEAGNDCERVALKAGLGSPDAPVRVEPGTSERLPSVFVFFHPGGIEPASNAAHRYVRQRVLPAERLRCVEEFPTLNHMHFFGNPNPSGGDWVSRDQIVRSARTAADLGHFFFDISIYWFIGANWFDSVRLDHPTESLFPPPGGLESLCDEIRSMGLKVALWVEPERVSLHGGKEFRDKFPDGVFRPTKPGSLDGLADLGRDDIAEWLFEKLDTFITRYKLDGIFYDHNFNAGVASDPDSEKPMYRYYRNYYRILDRLRRKHPGVRMLLCAGGGRRMDLGMMRYAHALQISDRIGDPLLMLQQMWAATLIFPIELIERYPYSKAWSNWQGEALIRYGRFLLRSTMMGVFSSANDYDSLSAEALALIREHNQFYRRELVPIINGADVYRLTDATRLLRSPRAHGTEAPDFSTQRRTEEEWFALQEHNPVTDRHAIFVFRFHPKQDHLTLKPKALDAARTYRVRDWDQGSECRVSGRQLIEEGLKLTLRHDFDSAVVLLESAPAGQ